MFASLKNKIREETGNDISKLTQKITSSTAQRIDSLRGRSTHGSTSSINSLVSSDGVKEDGSYDLKSEDELKRKISRQEIDFAKKLDEKEREWKASLAEKDRRLQNLERDNEELNKNVASLRESLKNAEGI